MIPFFALRWKYHYVFPTFKIIMTSLARKSEDYTFQCDRWFSNKEEGDISLIELPAVVKGKETAKGIMIYVIEICVSLINRRFV